MNLPLIKYLAQVFLSVQSLMFVGSEHIGRPRDLAVAAATVIAGLPENRIPYGHSRETLTAIMANLAWTEGRNDPLAIGRERSDEHVKHSSYSSWQILDRPEALHDTYIAARLSLYVLLQSIRMCPERPLAGYIGGCHNRTAIKMSNFRMAEIQYALAMWWSGDPSVMGRISP